MPISHAALPTVTEEIRMRILVVGASGTIGRPLCAELERRHDIVRAGRSSGDVLVDIRSRDAIVRMYEAVGDIDACVCVAASGAMDDFDTLTDTQLIKNMQGKLIGQINLVLLGRQFVSERGSFTLTSGIFADEPWRGVTGGAVISGGLHSFVLSAAIELDRNQRINIVSPTMVQDSVTAYGHLFPGMPPVSVESLIAAYVRCIEGGRTGEIIRAYR